MDFTNVFMTALYGTAFIVSASAFLKSVLRFQQSKREINEYEQQIKDHQVTSISAKDVTQELKG